MTKRILSKSVAVILSVVAFLGLSRLDLNGKTQAAFASDITMSDFFTDKEEVTGYDYSFAVVGDPQVLTNRFPSQLPKIFDYIIDNKEEKNTQYVFNLGDSTEHSTDVQWQTIRTQFDRFNGVLPYSVVRGNHDTPATFYQYMGAENNATYINQFEGFYKEGYPNTVWRTFKVGDTDYLILNLDYAAGDPVLMWAGQAVASHPNHKVIVSTHHILADTGDFQPDGVIYRADHEEFNSGKDIWDKFLSRYENIFLVLCGHTSPDIPTLNQTKGVHGNTVTTLLVNSQAADDKQGIDGTGMVVNLYIYEDEQKIEVEQYSTVKQAFCMQSGQYTINLTETEHEHARSSGLSKNSTHHWYTCTAGADCMEELDKAPHTFGGWSQTLAPTKDTAGKNERACTVCGYVETQTVSPTGGCGSSFGTVSGIGAMLIAASAILLKRKSR